MRVLLAATLAALLCSGTAFATTQRWKAGWDNFKEPLNFTTSNVTWSVSATTKALNVTFTLNGARPTKLYQVGFHLFCTKSPANFGRFPFDAGASSCGLITRQGKSAGVSAVEFGVILRGRSVQRPRSPCPAVLSAKRLPACRKRAGPGGPPQMGG
jgi:hypothetical protein